MPYPYFNSPRPAFFLVFVLAAVAPVSGQSAAPPASQTASRPAESVKASAYYHFSVGHLYEELAAAYGNRGDYVNKAIDNYRLAMQEDPSASFLVKDIAELYRMSGRVREAIDEAQLALKNNPGDLNAHRVLARVYTDQINDTQANRVDEGVAKRALDEYKIVTDKDPKDVDSLVMMGRLQKLLGNSVDSETAYKQALAVDPDNEDAITGLASVYSDRGDPKAGADLLERLNKKGPTPRTLIALAGEYEQLRQYSEAAEAYRQALDMDSSRVELKGAMAQDLASAGRYDDAIKAFQDLADANPQDSAPYIGMSQIYRTQKKFTEASATLDKAKAIEPDSVEIRYNDVLLLQDEGKTNEAITELKGIVDSTSKRVGTGAERAARAQMLTVLGNLYRVNQQFDLAVDAFRQSAGVNPDPDSGSRSEAQIIETYRVGKDLPKAQAESDAALKKYPGDRLLLEVRSEVLGDEGKTADAIAELRKLLTGHNDDFEIHRAITDRYSAAKDYAGMGEALDAADKLAVSKDDKEAVTFTRVTMYEHQKKYDLAEKELRKMLEMDPSNASALNYLGYMLADQGVRLEEAQDLIKRAVQIEPNNYAFLDSLGWVYYHLNKLDDAEAQLTRSLQISSGDPTIHDHLGDVYVKEGKLKEAIDQWQASLKAFNTTSPEEIEPGEVSKVQKKLDSARVRLAKEHSPARDSN